MKRFGMPTWELVEYSIDALTQAAQVPGHHTLKVDPLADTRLLNEFGFYYCDTLIEPHCAPARLRKLTHPEAAVSKDINPAEVLKISHGAFAHGRFHRDFNLDKGSADQRYAVWLQQLIDENCVYGLYWAGELAGFIAVDANKLVLHATSEKFRGKGLSKYWWSEVSGNLFTLGHDEVKSSISASNLAVLNLYASLGFSFRNPLDAYHCLIP
jgi:hypothetical protein